MNRFPNIKHIDDILPALAGKDYIGVNKQSNGATVICYNISNGDSFATPFEKECRGITFDRDGKIVSRPLHKFFNLAERDEVLPQNLDWDSVTAVFDKMDGSMITAGVFHGEVFVKSKKSFESDVAVAALAYIRANQKYYDFIKHCADLDLTPIFEYTSPNNRIVLRYDDEKMTLLHVRHNITGEYHTPAESAALAQSFDIPVNVPLFGKGFDLAELLTSLNTVEGIEGYVIQFSNGEMVKVKTRWYVNLHHAVTFVRERDIARLVLSEKIDDYIAFVALNAPDADLSHIHRINDTIKGEIEGIKKDVADILAQHQGVDFKTLATTHLGHKYFSFIMTTARGKEVDYLDYYERNRLKEVWSLEQIDLGDFTGSDESEEEIPVDD
jgi:RNA ligase